GIQAETSQEVSSLGAGKIEIEAFPESGVVVPGVEQTVFAVVTYAEKAGLDVRATLPFGPMVKTSALGVARVRVHPDLAADRVKIAAYAYDGGEGSVELQTDSDALVVSPDRETYGAGETARVTVLGGRAGDRVALRMTKGNEPVATGSCVVAA